MTIDYGQGTTRYGPGVSIWLSGEEVATALAEFVVARQVQIQGPRTITVQGHLCEEGEIYVDPSGSVVVAGFEYSGRGPLPR